jgi:hypothetical protein
MADIRTLKLQLLADTAQFSTGLNKASTDTQSFTSKVDKIVATAAKAFLGLATAVGTAAFAIGVSAVKAAIEDEKAQVSLAQTLRNTTKATDQQIAATEDYIDATARATGIADDQLRPSLDRLVRSTQDVTKAQKLQQLALDIAAGTGKDLAAVTEALGKAYDGNLGALKRIGVPLDENIVKTKDFDAAVIALSETFAGQAAAAAETFAGRMQRVQIAVDEAKEQIGFALLPFMEKLAKFVTDNLVPALEGLVNGLTRSGKQGLTKAFYDAGTGAVTFGYDLDSTEGKAYLLGEQIRELGDAVGKLLAVDPNTGESLLIKLIDSLTKIIEKTEAAINAFERFKESFVGGAILDIATAPIRSAGALASGNPGQVININNTFGATNSKAQAQTVVKSINNAAKAGTVNKFVKPMIPGR